MDKSKMGIIGAGIMATGMAQNFLKHGYAVTVWNRTRAHTDDLIAAGATWKDSPKEVAEASDIVIECVSDDKASREVWTNPKTGILATAAADKIYIASSSLSLEWIDELAALCKNKGIDFLDMPLTGSRAGAEGGTLRVMVGGDEKVLEKIRPALEAIAEKIYYFGPAGAGMRFKLILNTLIGIHMNAAAQAAVLAEKAGLDLTVVQYALFDGTMGPASPTTNMLFKNMDMPAEQVNFATKLIEKDLRYAEEMATQYGVTFDLLNDTQADFAKAIAAGYGDQDQTKLKKYYEQYGRGT
jgi:3-hydroxyisobutyrate dehydrogenase-like beta-hydroxyacid dehydrogenase